MKKIIQFLMIMLLTACQQQADVTEINISGNKIECDTSLTRAYPVILIGDTLISSSYAQDRTYCISVFRNDSLVTLGSIFPIGNGDGEYNIVKHSNNSISGLNIIDMVGNYSAMRRYEHYDIGNILTGLCETSNAHNIPEIQAFRYVTDNFININDSLILINGSTYDDLDHIFSTINTINGKITPLEFWPEDNFKGPLLPKHSVYTDNAKILASRDKYLYKCGEERYAFIFTIKGDKVNVEKVLFHDLPDFEGSSDGLNYTIRKRSCNRIECDVTDQFIYILLINKNYDGEIATNWTQTTSGNEVRVFDWAGNLKKILYLDNVGSNLKVSDDNSLLYLFSDNFQNGDHQVFTYLIGNHLE